MYKSKNHSKYNLKAHLIFVVKYRKKLLTSDIAFFIKGKFLQIAERSDFDIELMETDRDHIHLLVDYAPKVSILQIIRRLKQESTYDLWKNYSSILKKHFWKEKTVWSDGYFVCSIGEGVSCDTIQKYIESRG